MSKERLQWWLNLANKVQLDPCLICPDILAFAYGALHHPRIKHQKSVLLMDIGASSIGLVGVEYGEIKHLRVIRLGTRFFQENTDQLDDLSKTTLVLPLPISNAHR